MGQLCCFPFSRTEEKIHLVQGPSRAVRTSQTRGAEPNDEELVSLSKRLVEDAVLRAVQQYMEEARQDSSGPTDQGSPSASK